MASSDKPILVSVDAIAENGWNPNSMAPDKWAALKRNIKRFGFNQSITLRPLNDPAVDATYEVVDGAHRLRAARELGIKQVPAIVREFTDAEAKLQTIAHNEIHGEMDPALTLALVRDIDAAGVDGLEDLSVTGFIGLSDDDVAAWEKAIAPTTEPTPPAPAEDQTDDVDDGYFIVVTCADEAAQLALLERLEADGYACRMVVS